MNTAATNVDRFRTELTWQYIALFESDPEYAYARSRTTPSVLATKMTHGLRTGAANKDGDGIKRTCKALGIKHTYAAIRTFLEGQQS